MSENSNNKPSTLHRLPFSVDYDGLAKTTAYFNFSKTSPPKNEYRCSFRGRALRGISVQIPEDYKVGVVQKINSNSDEQEDPESLSFNESSPFDSSIKQPNLVLKQSFDNWIEWGHDFLPNDDNNAISALNWIQLSELIHSD
ncbi:hypothetical protein BB560_006166 [Smittium megazygosporum]|uniref:Uncharacterized protein n=1 Tax=Smittium megazygosporum TaxID=133381 RepID=A0A2T9YF29_9FUNG|nr:hypothetical protein BB560_006166 [Smittium megazygosporum]